MKKKTILIVDDDRSVAEMTGISIESSQYIPIICASGDEAISHIKKVDLLLTDFNMSGGMNGAELTKIAKQQNPDLPVVIMTGTPENVPADHLADEIIEKPFKIEQLKKVIDGLLQR